MIVDSRPTPMARKGISGTPRYAVQSWPLARAAGGTRGRRSLALGCHGRLVAGQEEKGAGLAVERPHAENEAGVADPDGLAQVPPGRVDARIEVERLVGRTEAPQGRAGGHAARALIRTAHDRPAV